MATISSARKLMSAAVALTACTLMSLPGVAAWAAPADVSIDGYVSDSKCGRMHGADGPDVACVKKCIAEGAKPVFVDDKTGAVWTIDDPDAVKGHYGHHIIMTGTADAEKKVVHVSKVTMLAKQ